MKRITEERARGLKFRNFEKANIFCVGRVLPKRGASYYATFASPKDLGRAKRKNRGIEVIAQFSTRFSPKNDLGTSQARDRRIAKEKSKGKVTYLPPGEGEGTFM